MMLRQVARNTMRLCQSKLMEEGKYLDFAREKLGELGDLAEESGGPDIDIALTDKILRINHSRLTVVVNTQTPNRQLWYSSTVSGPQRFDYNSEKEQWVSQAGNILD